MVHLRPSWLTAHMAALRHCIMPAADNCIALQVWVKPEVRDGKVYWLADSDSALTKVLQLCRACSAYAYTCCPCCKSMACSTEQMFDVLTEGIGSHMALRSRN